MMVQTFEGYGVFDMRTDSKIKIVNFAKTKKEAIEKACDYREDGDDMVVYKILILRNQKPVKV